MKPLADYKRIGSLDKRQAIASARVEMYWHTAVLSCVAPYYYWVSPLKKDGCDE